MSERIKRFLNGNSVVYVYLQNDTEAKQFYTDATLEGYDTSGLPPFNDFIGPCYVCVHNDKPIHYIDYEEWQKAIHLQLTKQEAGKTIFTLQHLHVRGQGRFHSRWLGSVYGICGEFGGKPRIFPMVKKRRIYQPYVVDVWM